MKFATPPAPTTAASPTCPLSVGAPREAPAGRPAVFIPAVRSRWLSATSSRWLFAAVLPLVAGCQTALLDPKGPIGHAERTILLDSLLIMLVIVVPTILATLGVAWWFRASNRRATHLPDWDFSGRVEIVVWAIPLMVIILLGGVTWLGSYQLDPARPIDAKAPALPIQAVSLDWKWLFIYPDQRIATVNQLVVPAGVPLRFSLTSASVMNTFFVPQLGSMIYTMNGMASQLNLLASEPGTFRGLSAHFSGDGFPNMNFPVHAVAPEVFAAWVADTRHGSQSLDAAGYRVLAQQTLSAPASAYGSVEPGLFDQIVAQHLPPGPGPSPTGPGSVRPEPAGAKEH